MRLGLQVLLLSCEGRKTQCWDRTELQQDVFLRICDVQMIESIKYFWHSHRANSVTDHVKLLGTEHRID